MIQTERVARRASVLILTGALLMLRASVGFAQTSVLTQHNDNNRDGVNASEATLNASNVNSGQFGLLFKVAVDDQVYAQPLYMANLAIAGGTHNVVFVATTNNSVYAFDADNGTQYWHVQLGPAYNINDNNPGCKDVLATSGIMSTPVIDPSTNKLYVVAQTWVNGTSTHFLHALSVASGADIAGSPVTVTTSNFNSVYENQRAGLLLANNNVYIAFSSHCDHGLYAGFTIAYSTANLSQTGVFNPGPNNSQSAIWQSGNGAAADSAGNVYVITGNGAWDGETEFGESFLKFNSGLTLEDWHTPTNWGDQPGDLNYGDADLTASGPVLIPGKNLIVGGGKDGKLHLLNTGAMGHLTDAGVQPDWQATSSHIHSLNYWNGNLYVWGQNDYLKVFSFNGSTFNTTPTYTLGVKALAHPGGTLSLSANGNTNGILWAATNTTFGSDNQGAWHTTVPGILYAYNATNMNLLWTNEQNAPRDSCDNYAKFTAPTIVNGKVYLASFGQQSTASGQVCVYGQLPATNLIPNGTYVVVDSNSGKALDDPGFSLKNGTVMEIYTVNNGPNQKWTVNNLGNNVITLTNGSSGQLLDVTGASTANSALIDQYPANGQTNQQWRVTSAGGGKFELVSVSSGQALDVDKAAVANQTQVDQFPYQGHAWQQWTFQAR